MDEPAARTCPSSTCAPGNLLIGIVRPDGTIAPVRPPLEVDDEFAERAAAGDRPPEARLRFAGPCVTSACGHWQDSRCGLADRLTTGPSDDSRVPPCAIRSTCRWWEQRGVAACRVCPVIVHTRSGGSVRDTVS